MFALISVGMAFVIITGGIDLSVGTVAALASVVAALASPHGGLVAVLAGRGAGLADRRVERPRHHAYADPAVYRHACDEPGRAWLGVVARP